MDYPWMAYDNLKEKKRISPHLVTPQEPLDTIVQKF